MLANWTGWPPPAGTRQRPGLPRLSRVNTSSSDVSQSSPLSPLGSAWVTVVRSVPCTVSFRMLPSGAPKAIQRPSGENSG